MTFICYEEAYLSNICPVEAINAVRPNYSILFQKDNSGIIDKKISAQLAQ